MPEPLYDDPVVAEIHATRAAMIESAGGNIDVLMQQVAEHQQRSNRQIIREPLRNRTEPVAAPGQGRQATRGRPDDLAGGPGR